MNWRKSSRIVTVCIAAAVAVAVLQGCTTLKRQAAVPVALQGKAEIPGLSGVRYRVGIDDARMARDGIECH